MSDKGRGSVVGISAVADCEGMVDTQSKIADEPINYSMSHQHVISNVEETMKHTFVLVQAPGIFYVEVWKGAMDMRADLLTGLSRTESSNDGDCRRILRLR